MEGILVSWWFRAVVIAAATSAVLNISPFLPWLRDIKPSRIVARWVGYFGIFSALALWITFFGTERDWVVFRVGVCIVLLTLIPNTLVHLRAESLGQDEGGGDGRRNGRLPHIIIVSAEECESLVSKLAGNGRELSNALLAIETAILKSRRLVKMAPDRTGGQIWLQSVRDPLETASNLIEETRGDIEAAQKKAISYRKAIEQLCEAWRRGEVVVKSAG